MGVSLLLVAAAVGAPALKDKPANPDLYGEWDSLQVDGETGGPAFRYRFNKDGTWQVFWGGKELNGSRGFRFDPKARPAEIDLNTPPGPKTPLVRGIYRIEGDELWITTPKEGDRRPTEFRGPSTVLEIFRRAKPKD
ncbi:MAG: hypothetical protein J2P46_13555 [Zavarzinella sp.]|nr:hypothetical protein [Zavarzinella sp.]